MPACVGAGMQTAVLLTAEHLSLATMPSMWPQMGTILNPQVLSRAFKPAMLVHHLSMAIQLFSVCYVSYFILFIIFPICKKEDFLGGEI